MEKRDLSYTTGGNVNGYNHDEEEYRGSLKNYVWNYVRYDPAVPLQGIYREKSVF